MSGPARPAASAPPPSVVAQGGSGSARSGPDKLKAWRKRPESKPATVSAAASGRAAVAAGGGASKELGSTTGRPSPRSGRARPAVGNAATAALTARGGIPPTTQGPGLGATPPTAQGTGRDAAPLTAAGGTQNATPMTAAGATQNPTPPTAAGTTHSPTPPTAAGAARDATPPTAQTVGQTTMPPTAQASAQGAPPPTAQGTSQESGLPTAQSAAPNTTQGTGRAVAPKASAVSVPGLRRVAAHVGAAKRALARHPAPAAEVVAAQRAAVAPTGERAAFAGPDQAAAIASAQAKPFDRAGFIAKFEQRIQHEEPKDEAAAKAFADPARPDTLTPQLSGETRAAADTTSGEVRAAAATPPDPTRVPERPAVPLTPDRPPPPPAPPAAVDAVPPPVRPSAVDVSGHARGTTAGLAGAGLTDETLARANEPSFSAALQAKRAAERNSATAPSSFRAKEAEQRTAAGRRAATAGGAAMAAMAGVRAAAGRSVMGGKRAAQSRTEARRAEITTELTGIYEKTRQAVDAALAGLDDTVRTLFDERAGQARKRFLAACEKNWLLRFFTGDPDYAAHAAVYTAEIRGVVDEVAGVVEKRVNDARQRAADGRREMAVYVAGLEPGMREFGERTAADFAERFDALEASVDERADAVVEVLAESYAQAQAATDAALAEVKEANKNLWDRARDAVVGAVKVLVDLRNLLLGVVKRAAGVADRIVKNPIGFLANLGASVKAGLMGFLANIVTHLKAALKDWLFGSLAQTGVELPEQWDLRGVVKLVLSLFGISWAFVRGELLKHMPEPVLNTVIGAVRVIGTVRDKGVGGLWEEIRDKVGDLKQQAFDLLRQFVVETVLRKGVDWLLSLVTPAGALVKAVMAVYDFLTFLVDKARALGEFVNGILDTLEEVCNGVSQKVATKIETSLARALPLAIDLLARVIGLGAVPAKIKGVLEKVGAPVRGFVSGMIAKAAAYGKRLLAGGRKAVGKLAGKLDRRTPQEKERDVRAGVRAGVEALNRLKGKPFDEKIIKAVLFALRVRYGLTSLVPVAEDGKWAVKGTLNPKNSATSDLPAPTRKPPADKPPRYGNLDGHGRATRVTVVLRKKSLGGRTNPTVDPADWDKNANKNKVVFHRSHLLGAQLGGSNSDRRNFVTLYAHANTPTMRDIENKVRDVAKKRGKYVNYKVKALYNKSIPDKPSKAQLRPTGVHIKATGDFKFDGVVQNKP